uniref:Major facilitator superfamily (MFS) profile domain-containing protein n=1 Tax=Panagrolaimus davidi TaxID=227884 RepID=A0A914P3V1_9BILA
MLGAVVGAFISGFLADSFGRKPVVVGAMIIMCIGNALLAGFGHLTPYLSTIIFFVIGASCGGYMVTNLVLMIENLEHAKSRLLVVSLNGWPLGMAYVGLVAWISKEWRTYHIIFAATSAALFIILQCISLESVRWLIHQKRIRRADKIQLQIDSRNFRVNELLPKIMQSQEFERAKTPTLMEIVKEEKSLDRKISKNKDRKLTYFDLFRHSSVRKPLLALCYCFATSSVVSFGFYFSVEALPGSRYLNLAAMGLLKFGLGFLPFLVSYFVGRRPIILTSVGVACISIWIYLGFSLGLNLSKHWIITFLGLLITASIDPTWKINHLYSAELFPTTVRNMSRAVCNVGARLGSLAAPLIVYSRQWFTETPIIVFAIMLTIQWGIVYFVFPETKDRPLPEEISDDEDVEIVLSRRDEREDGLEDENEKLAAKV